MNSGGLPVPVGVNIPLGHGAVGVCPDDLVLAVDGVSGDLRPALIGAIADAATTFSDVIESAIGELNPTHA